MNTPRATAIALASCATGTDAVMVAADTSPPVRGRLAAMGLVPGVRLHVLRKDRAGPVVVAVHGTRLAVGRSVAERIHVRPCGR
ncbi:MAG: ferrous iron transport protein A [Kiritimatiellae bacterium]|nr:ferrous iron transport protein A [Kiritimatiellia bacterium]